MCSKEDKPWLCNAGTCLCIPSEFILADGGRPATLALCGLCHTALMSLYTLPAWPTFRRLVVSVVEKDVKIELQSGTMEVLFLVAGLCFRGNGIGLLQ